MKKIAIILSGCGNKDGSEITETVLLNLALHQLGANTEFFAPDFEYTAVNYLNNETTQQINNALSESAKIARGQIKNVNTLIAENFDALVFPGGLGAARNLSNWTTDKIKGELKPEIKNIILNFHKLNKPMGAICIAPVLFLLAFKKSQLTLTLGQNNELAKLVESSGHFHELCPSTDYITDRDFKLITTPAFMNENATLPEIFKGISGLAKELVEMA